MSRTLTRQEASDAITDLGWRYILGTLRTSVPVRSLTEAAQLAASAVADAAADADRHLRVDLRPDRVIFTLQSLDEATVTTRDIELAKLITTAAEPRTQRNRIHFDVSVPHDEAQRRIEATLAAGGRLLSDAEAPAFWVLADPEGNEACITTWQGRD